MHSYSKLSATLKKKDNKEKFRTQAFRLVQDEMFFDETKKDVPHQWFVVVLEYQCFDVM